MTFDKSFKTGKFTPNNSSLVRSRVSSKSASKLATKRRSRAIDIRGNDPSGKPWKQRRQFEWSTSGWKRLYHAARIVEGCGLESSTATDRVSTFRSKLISCARFTGQCRQATGKKPIRFYQERRALEHLPAPWSSLNELWKARKQSKRWNTG